jgi:hypothetical protein
MTLGVNTAMKLKIFPILVLGMLLQGCSGDTESESSADAITMEQVTAAAISWNCTYPPADALLPTSYTKISSNEYGSNYQYNKYGDYESAPWGSDASNYFVIKESTAGWTVRVEGAGARTISYKWKCKDDFILLGVELTSSEVLSAFADL